MLSISQDTEIFYYMHLCHGLHQEKLLNMKHLI